MLVINANNQQDTTNYMIGENYPDLNSILIRGCPQHFTHGIRPRRADGDYAMNFGPDDLDIIETVGTYKINMFSKKANKQMLYSGQSFQTPIENISTTDYMPDMGFFSNIKLISGSSAQGGQYPQKLQFGYNIAVKGLSAGEVIGEKIYAPLLLGLSFSDNRAGVIDPNSLPDVVKADYYAPYMAVITFKLLHTDGTTEKIADVNLTTKYRNRYEYNAYTSNFFPKYITNNALTTAITGTSVIHLSSNNTTSMGVVGLDGYYDGAGKTAQEGDYLVAEVRVYLSRINATSADTYFLNIGIYGGGSNNNNMRDIFGFRPFQVSIRDA